MSDDRLSDRQIQALAEEIRAIKARLAEINKVLDAHTVLVLLEEMGAERQDESK